MKEIKVHLSTQEKAYNIEFPKDFNSLDERLLKQISGRNFLLVTDENVFEKSPFFNSKVRSFQSPTLLKNILVLPPGEIYKTWETVEKILNKAFELNLDRTAVFIVIGGGIYGDLVGFAASIFMRGVPFVQVPTSLLAMVDSSVGGKTGYNCTQGKNLIGAFHQPETVLCCSKFLETLPLEEVKNGIAEMVKHGILTDSSHFENLEKLSKTHLKDGDCTELFKLVPDSITIKKQIVEQDEKESGIRGHLNLGHTFGHAVEHLSNFEIPHGRAIAIGTVMATQYAAERKLCDWDLVDRIENIFNQFDIDLVCDFSEKEIFKAMEHDKKKKDGKIRLILPKKIGKVEYFEMEN
ncbi:3-dehydroquinate synthase [Candidatus Gracilibacteria bacterium]|nr:3-dehydroquinate synthase [Candidatus Gracilibacteria bacterium]